MDEWRQKCTLNGVVEGVSLYVYLEINFVHEEIKNRLTSDNVCRN